MADFAQQDLADSRFEQVHLQRATFHQVHLNDADFDDVDLTGAQFREVFFKDVVMRSTGFVNVRIEGEIDGLTVNGVDVTPLVQAELERREPDFGLFEICCLKTSAADLASSGVISASVPEPEMLWMGTLEIVAGKFESPLLLSAC